PGVTPLPNTPCDWVAGPRMVCTWSLRFRGDAATCTGLPFVGYTQMGNADQCPQLCGANDEGISATGCYVAPGDAGDERALFCDVATGPTCGKPPNNGGRRPDYFSTLGFGPSPRGRELGTHFARAALLEAGSVHAFRVLRSDLVAHRAPRRFVRAAQR